MQDPEGKQPPFYSKHPFRLAPTARWVVFTQVMMWSFAWVVIPSHDFLIGKEIDPDWTSLIRGLKNCMSSILFLIQWLLFSLDKLLSHR
jgi:hypothetical protein